MDMYWFMLVMMVSQTSWSATVTITPENIAVEYGTDSVNFTCTIGLDMIEAAHTNWIIWWKDGTRVADNYYVYLDHAKYSVHDDPSANSTHYTQTLQIHSIINDDNDTYICQLYITPFPALLSTGARLLITYLDIPQPICSNQTRIYSLTGKLSLIMSCSCPSGYSQIILQWTDNEDNELTTEPQVAQNGSIVLSAAVSIESDTNNKWFTCRSTRPGSPETKECVIGNMKVTMTTSNDNNIPMTSTNKVIQPTFTSSANLSNTKFMNNIPIIIVVVLAGILLVSFMVSIVVVGKRKNTNNEEIDPNSCQNGQWLEAANPSSDEVTGATVIANRIEDNKLYNIQLGDIDQQLEYKSSAFETDTYDFDHSYAAVNQTNAEEHERLEVKADYLKSSDPLKDYSGQAVGIRNTGKQDHKTEHEYQKNIITADVDSEFMSAADIESKRKPPVPAKKLNKSTKPKVINYPAPNGDLYAQVDKPSKSIPVRNTTSPNGDLYAQVDKFSKSIPGKNKTQRNEEQLKENSVDEGHKRETEGDENHDGEDDNVSRTSLDSTGSIHYSVDEDTVYARVLKQQ